jgi:hypothetical protein
MTPTAATLERGDDPAMNPALTEPGPARLGKAEGATKFLYSSGSRPLSGYTIKRGIGRGGFGEVYYATSDAGKEVAIKLIRRNLDVELRGVSQCLNLKHPNLLALYDIRQDEHDDSWVVMEYVAGESLEDAIARNPNGMPLDEVQRWFTGLVAGVACLHDHGIVHRDLKPGNIFSDDGIVKVGDYGLSKFISCSRRSGQTESVGTVHYMAPEIANGRYGKEIDIYALGIILYEMLTGHVPFDGESVGEVLMKHLTAEPVLEKVPDPYRTAVARALTKDPDQRVRTLMELLLLLPGSADVASAPYVATVVEPAALAPVINPSFGQAGRVSPEPDVLVAQTVDPPTFWQQEPIARGVADAGRRFAAWWNNQAMTPNNRVAFLVVTAVVATLVVPWIIGPLMAIGVLYCIYLLIFAVVRSMVVTVKRPYPYNASPLAPPSGSPPRQRVDAKAASAGVESVWPGPLPPPKSRRERLLRRHLRSSAQSIAKPFAQQMTELTGAMMFSTVLVLALSLVACMLRGVAPHPAQYAWLALTSLVGTWLVLIPAKFWEGHKGEPVLRRFTMMTLGLVLGVVAAGTRDWLLADLPTGSSGPWRPQDINSLFSSGTPEELWLHMAYFGFLFALPAWWYQAHPHRSYRVGFIVTGIAVGWAALIMTFWKYPWPWGIMAAATISLAVQLASPRTERPDSHARREEYSV